ncbi:hypothetical protein Vretimale_17671 [Volvox reticuliferus]|uniref:protein-tyrosine-phosphatase n=1 Tax=Volvox reticuliferus TaxID=1737510 RepID=A0A8J4C3K5_9CHLO|nr:hypothetical protein Vretifemale_3583 [Volvox reticuliferus]GIM14811.1 hypothetical protein Vretimale_17671 [Volvox reticuliferus]
MRTSFTCKETSSRSRNARNLAVGASTKLLPIIRVIRRYERTKTFHCSYQDARHADGHVQQLTESVERLVVEPVIRTAPWDEGRLREQEQKPQACILLISESDVCRTVLAAASLREMLVEEGLEGRVEISTCGTRPYNLDEGPEPAATAAVEALGLEAPVEHTARLFDPAHDIVSYDLLLVMDKYTAGDVMREVSSFELINRTTQFSHKVRRLGEFLGASATHGSGAIPQYGGEADELDIEDPLYGNVGGEEEEQAVMRVARAIWEACRGLVRFLRELEQQQQQESVRSGGGVGGGLLGSEELEEPVTGTAAGALGPALREKVRTLGPTSWLSPPMLSPRVDLNSVPQF